MNERDESGSEEIAERRTEKQTNYGQGIKAQKRYRRERSEEENQDRKMMKKRVRQNTTLESGKKTMAANSATVSCGRRRGEAVLFGCVFCLKTPWLVVASATKTIFSGQRKISANTIFTTTVH